MAQLALAALGAGAVVPAAAVLLVGFAPAAVALAVAGHLAGAGLALVLLRRGYPHGDLGLCNLVTLTRLALASALLAPLLAPASSWAVLGVAIAALALDGVDGWLARREGRVSAFGARLDVEVDAALGLILALNAWASGAVGAGVLLLGLPRYGYIAAGWALPWMARPLPERFGRKLVCVVQMTVLIALQAPALGAPLQAALVAGAATALIWSFGRDALWLWRTRP
ncbi:MAG: CDP-alcohol phosphatidyltransferase family protein [Paracoccaceae bacterium]